MGLVPWDQMGLSTWLRENIRGDDRCSGAGGTGRARCRGTGELRQRAAKPPARFGWPWLRALGRRARRESLVGRPTGSREADGLPEGGSSALDGHHVAPAKLGPRWPRAALASHRHTARHQPSLARPSTQGRSHPPRAQARAARSTPCACFSWRAVRSRALLRRLLEPSAPTGRADGAAPGDGVETIRAEVGV
jgi:hypothetical protein